MSHWSGGNGDCIHFVQPFNPGQVVSFCIIAIAALELNFPSMAGRAVHHTNYVVFPTTKSLAWWTARQRLRIPECVAWQADGDGLPPTPDRLPRHATFLCRPCP